MNIEELLKLSPGELTDLVIYPTCFNRENGGALYGDTSDKMLYEDEDIECFFVGNPRADGHMCICSALLKALKQTGIHTAVDTCGAVSKKAVDAVLPFTDIFLYDIKAIDESIHVRGTGISNRQILENFEYLAEKNVPVEVRYPFVPGYNDGEAEKIAVYLSGFSNITKVRVLPYHNYAGSKYTALGLKNTLPTVLPDNTTLEATKLCFSKHGLTVG